MTRLNHLADSHDILPLPRRAGRLALDVAVGEGWGEGEEMGVERSPSSGLRPPSPRWLPTLQMTSVAGRRLLIAAVLIFFASTGTALAFDDIDFNRDIRPILSNHCFQCHGMDEGSRQADLRLDHVDTAIESGTIVPGSAEASEMIARVASEDESILMPPPDANKPLTVEQIELLTQWVEQGAAYDEHWAFRPIASPPVPEVLGDPWCRNEIDAFILDRLQQEGITPSEEAARETLIRRLNQDLLGLLPTPEEVEAFVNDDSPGAYHALVERLLSSSHYGERWGRHWLDQARYADSSGYTIDGERIMWPYRDWVIWAMNEDMPFDQFTIEQLAGDLLPEPSLNQLVATAFHRNTMINQEGGVKPDQFRNEALIDRVSTTGAVWLGLTVGCAQCHSHKFDPISHEEFYSLYAFFNQATDSNSVGATTPVHVGEIFGWSDEQHQLLAELQSLRAEETSLTEQLSQLELGAVEWEWHAAEYAAIATASSAQFDVLEDGSLMIQANATENEFYELTLKGTLPEFTAIRVRVLPHESLPMNGPGTASNGNFVLTEASLKVDGQVLRFMDAWADHSQPDYSVRDAVDDSAIDRLGHQRRQRPARGDDERSARSCLHSSRTTDDGRSPHQVVPASRCEQELPDRAIRCRRHIDADSAW